MEDNLPDFITFLNVAIVRQLLKEMLQLKDLSQPSTFKSLSL